jgi:hypothetical protein
MVVGEDDTDVIGATTGRLTFVAEHGGFILCQAVRLASVVGQVTDPVRTYYGGFPLMAE